MFRASVLAGGLFALSLGAAQAAVFEREVTPNNETQYCVEYRPAIYQYNTRGKLVKGEARVWEGEIAHGAIITHRRVPATFMRTARMVEPDHYTMYAYNGACPD